MKLCINDFEGPLDLLLELVKKAKMDIYEIDTKYIIDEYLKFIDTIPKDDLDDASEYLVMASELIHLKSRLLLNLDNDDDSDEYTINSEEDLKNKLIEYERYKSVTNVFKNLEEKRSEFFTKIPENIKDYRNEENILDGEMNPLILKDILIELQKRMEYQKPINTRITKKEISVEERSKYIIDYLSKRKKAIFTELFEDYSKDLVVATFLSILELCKDKKITLSQDKNFSDIYIERVV